MSRKTLRLILITILSIGIFSDLVFLWSEAVQGSLSFDSLGYLFFFSMGIIGSLIVSRYPKHPTGWTFLAAFAYSSLDGLVSALIWFLTDRMPQLSIEYVTVFEVIQAYRESFNVGIWLSLLILPVLYFPNGKLPTPRWRFFSRTVSIMLVVEFLNPQLSLTWFPEGQGLISVNVLKEVAEITNFTLVLASVIAPLSLIFRFRSARRVEKQQIKWPLYTALLATIGIGIEVISITVSGLPEIGSPPTGNWIIDAGLALESLSVVAFPFSIGIGILRYRLYDIDLLINRTLVYTTLTTLLALTYFGSVLLTQQIFPTESPISIVVSTLAIAALFSPLRQRIQAAIDRRFYRKRYDAQQILALFSSDLRNIVSLEEITESLLKVLQETIQPKHVSLWMRESQR